MQQLLGAAQPTILQLGPSIRADRLKSIEQSVGIILVLDLQQAIIVDAIEGLLPVRLLEVALVHVRSRVRSQSLEQRDVVVSHLVLLDDHFGAGIPLPGSRKSGINERLTPGRQDSVVDITCN